MKQTIFISHAAPEDNYFVAWLSSKLRLMGYQVWVDFDDLLIGDSFWIEIENIIRNESIRFVTVISEHYVEKARTVGSGVFKEIQCAKTVKDIKRFIAPIKKDVGSFDEFSIDFLGLNAIDFSQNWALGLNELLDDFHKMNVLPSKKPENDILSLWRNALKIKTDIIQKEENYYSNWFPIELPDKIYIHQPEFYDEEELEQLPFSKVRIADRILTFYDTETVKEITELKTSYGYSTNEFISNYDIKLPDGFDLWGLSRKIIQLLNHSFREYLIKNSLSIYNLSGKKEIYYFSRSDENIKRISLKQFNKSGRNIIGKVGEFNWHFAVSHKASLFPEPHLKILHHIVFTDNSGNLINSDDQHALRRSFGSGWYNRKWFETLLAMNYKIGDYSETNYYLIPVSDKSFIKMFLLPIKYISPIGYIEPENVEDDTLS